MSQKIVARDGNLYGTAGGALGAIFRMAPGGSGFKTIHDFNQSPEIDGGEALTPLIQAADGNLYGTTCNVGAHSHGTAFRIGLDESFVVLHQCAGGPTDAARPCNSLVRGLDGNFYGVSQHGGPSDGGTVFRMTAAGDVTVLRSLNAGIAAPLYTSLIQSSNGLLYGNTGNTIFQISLAGGYLPLHEEPAGGFQGPLVHGRDGALYGAVRSSQLDGVFRFVNPAVCDATLALAYVTGTLHLGFTLKTPAPANWSTWMVSAGTAYPLWTSVPIPAITPAIFGDLPIPNFPHLGRVVVLTALTAGTGSCLDWKIVDTP